MVVLNGFWDQLAFTAYFLSTALCSSPLALYGSWEALNLEVSDCALGFLHVDSG